jgi:hypothetical protein
MRTVIAIDNSGSTSGSREYWETVERVCRENKGEMYVWGTTCALVSKFTDIRQGNSGGTNPQIILPLLTPETWLILFTDGEIGQGEVEACERAGLKLASSEIHVISPKEDYSAVIPFARAGPTTIYTNGQLVMSGVVDVNPESITLEEVTNNFESLAKRIQFSNMGRENAKMKVALLAKRAKFLNDISVANGSFSTELSMSNIQQILARSVNVLELTKKIDALVSYCDLKNTYKLQTSRESRALQVNQVVEPEEVDASVIQSFECPIIMDADVPALLVCESELSLTPAQANAVANCPLYLVNVENAFGCIDHPIGVMAFNEMGQGTPSPFTRRRVVGCIPLGCLDQHVSVGNSTVARAFSKGKLLGNPTLYLCAIYHYLKRTPYLCTNAPFMEAFEDHLRFRLRTYRTNIALSGEPEFPLVKVPIILALYYCCTHTTRLYQFYYYIETLFDSLKLFGELPDAFYEEVKGKCVLIGKLARYLNEYKGVTSVSRFHEVERACYQAHVLVGDAYVFLDGPTENPDVEQFALRHVISSSPQLQTLSKYPLPVLDGYVLPTPTVEFAQYAYEPNESIDICPRTVRPYMRPGGVAFEKLCEEIHHIAHKRLPVYEYYINYVCSRGAYPTEDELLLYTWKNVSNRGVDKLTTLPLCIRDVVHDCIRDFSCVSARPVDEFVKIATASRPRDARERMERSG